MKPVLPAITVVSESWNEYELLDSGRGRKLERFGPVIVDRGEPKAWWAPRQPDADWQRAMARHDEEAGGWTVKPGTPRAWPLRCGDVTFEARIGDHSKHLGVFPEQVAHWRWLAAQAPERPGGASFLNLFGYTGAATLAAARGGFTVTHVDASRPAVAWARHNQALNGMEGLPIRWIVDDAVKYMRREIRRGRRYDALALDPPSFGRGPAGEIWKAEEHLADLLGVCREALTERPRFVVLTLYAIEASALTIGNLLADMMRDVPGQIELGELALPHAHGQGLLPLAMFGRWRPG